MKTRMTQQEHSTHPLSPYETLELYKAFLADWIPRLKTEAGFDLWIMLGGAQREEMEAFRRRYSLHPSQLKQMPVTPSDLGALMERCFEQGFREGYTGIALIGSDAPQIPMLRIRRVFENLKKTPIVIGPDNGGGMYLIACSRPLGIMKKGITWGQGIGPAGNPSPLSAPDNRLPASSGGDRPGYKRRFDRLVRHAAFHQCGSFNLQRCLSAYAFLRRTMDERTFSQRTGIVELVDFFATHSQKVEQEDFIHQP